MTNNKRQTNNQRYWQAHVQAYKESGLTRAEYSRQHNLSCHALAYWQKKINSQSNHKSTLVPVILEKTPEKFVITDQAPLKILLPGNMKIEVGDNFSSATLVRLLSIMDGR